MSRTAEVLGTLRDAGRPLDDDELAAATGINRHYVNAICRRLASDGILLRRRGDTGKMLNSPLEGAQPGSTPMAAVKRRASNVLTRGTERRDERVEALIDRFSECVDIFERSEAFPGPSVYFHEKAIQRRRAHPDAVSALEDQCLHEYIYAVLPSWGMHRMGRQAAKVGPLAPIVHSLVERADVLADLWDLRISELDTGQANDVATAAWDVIAAMRVSMSGTQIVAGSKWLHHLLPDLIPPIDRQYTFSFFTGQKSVAYGDRQAFLTWLPLFADIGRERAKEIQAAIRRGGFMATGEAKVIDNAIMGFMQSL
jgi:hypothetical protein